MIRIKPGFFLRTVLDTHLVMGQGSDAYMPNQIMSVNDTGAFLWKALESGADRETLTDRLLAEYEVSRETAQQDVDRFLGQLRDKALIEE